MIRLTLPYPISAAPGVYRIRDRKTGRFYIGSSIDVAKRWRQHQYRLAQGTHPNPQLQALWNRDPARLAVSMLQECAADKALLLKAEQTWLDAVGVGTNRKCMNVLAVAGSHLGCKRSAATREALAAAARGRRPSQEARAKMSAAKIGRPLSHEHRRKLGDAARGKKLPPRERLPRPELRKFSDDQVRAIRAAKTAGESFTRIEASFHISRGALQRMLARQTYAEVE